MKRIFALVLALLCLILSVPALSADAIWEPADNFYESHREDCRFLQKEFTVNEETDGVKSPENDKPVRHLEAGEKLFILCVYTDGKGTQWGICEQYDEEKESWNDFWLPMEKLTKVYDSGDFLRDHANELVDAPALPETVHRITGKLPLWNYPGAEEYGCYLDTYYEQFDYTGYQGYVDELGGVWVYVPYFEGLDGWIYAGDPESLTPHPVSVPATPTVEPTEVPTATPAPTPTAIPQETQDRQEAVEALSMKLLIFSVAMVVLLSALIIIMLCRRGKKK